MHVALVRGERGRSCRWLDERDEAPCPWPSLVSSSIEPWVMNCPRPMTMISSALTAISLMRCEDYEHGAALVGERAEELADPADAFGVEAVDGLVEEQDLGSPRSAAAMPRR